jgi:large subunit ribosomal protein L25
MMEKEVLKADKREVVGRKVRALRREGKLPAVIYGRHVDPMNISLDFHSASRILGRLTSSSLVTIELEGKQYPTLVREKQLDYIRNSLLHVDFLAVSLTEKITASVSIQLEGDAPAVKEYGAILVSGLTELEVECLPTDLPERFVVDISSLEGIGDGINVKDVTGLENVEILSDPDEVIVVATAMAEEEEEEEEEILEGEEELEEPELIEKGKRVEEGEEGEEQPSEEE